MWKSTVTPPSHDGRSKGICGGTDGTLSHLDLPCLHSGINVQSDHGVHSLHSPVIDHAHCSTLAFRVGTFLTRLEQQAHPPGELDPREQHSRSQEHSGVGVMS